MTSSGSPQERHRQSLVELTPGYSPACQLRQRPLIHCRGRIQADHILKQRIIKNSVSLTDRREDALADGRNGMWLCEHHHMLKDRMLLDPPLRLDELPQHFWEFVREYELEWQVQRALRLRENI